MAGLVPAIHVFGCFGAKDVDAPELGFYPSSGTIKKRRKSAIADLLCTTRPSVTVRD
jgi:hypothetical protein